jgi:polar amino acid transport system permease protein
MEAVIENFFNIEVLLRSRHLLLSGFGTTLRLIVLIVLFGQAFGLLLAVMRYANRPYLNPFLIAYVDIVRAIPILVLLMLIYYALPFVGIKLPRFWAATLAMSLNGGAYYAEIFRSGIEAVDRGQIEAARSVGLSYLQAMRYVVLPQAFRIVLPPLTSNTLELIKATAVASVVALPDILKMARQAQSLLLNPTPLVGALILYLVILLPLVQLVTYFERRYPHQA